MTRDPSPGGFPAFDVGEDVVPLSGSQGKTSLSRLMKYRVIVDSVSLSQ